MKKILTMTALAAALSTTIAHAQSPEYILRFSNMYPEVSEHQKVYQAWADAVEKESQGRIKVQLFPGATLAKPNAQYDAVKNHIADVAMAVQGYTANRFPLTQIVELPGIVQNAKQGSCIIQSLYNEKLISQEYKDTKPLYLYTPGPGSFHTKDTAIRTPADLQGLRLRRPTAVVGKMLKDAGANPVGLPAPSAYPSLQRGVIDGLAMQWEGNYTFRLNELTKYHTEVGGLYTLAFIVTMNKGVYNSMPADLKAVIDHNSGMAWAEKEAKVFDSLDATSRKQALEMGGQIITVKDGANNPAWKPILDAATQGYLDDLEAKHLPARKVYKRALELAQTCST